LRTNVGVVSPYIRTVRTASGARAVQIVHSTRKGSRDIEHIGSAHTEADLELLKAVARQRMAGGQGELDLGIDGAPGPGPGDPVAPAGVLPITSSRMGHLIGALNRAYDVLGFDVATGGDRAFRDLVLARIIEPTSKLDSLRVLDEAGIETVTYRTLQRRLPRYAADQWRGQLSAACARHARVAPATLLLYDVTTLYFEIDEGDGFREPGFSKERRLEPQITVGLLTTADGFPLRVDAFEGNMAETKTMLPVITAFQEAYHVTDVTVVADAGMFSDANQCAIEDAGLWFILGMRIPEVPYVIKAWHQANPAAEIPDGQVFTQPWPAGPTDKRRDQTIYYQYSHDRARRTLRGIDKQVAKAEKAVAGDMPVKRNRFVKITGGARSVNRALETKARALAGIKGYLTNLPDPDPDTVIGAYHRLFQIEKSFRMSKHDLRARPIYHHTRESIDAHLNVVFAAMAVGCWIEMVTTWSIKKFVRTARRYRTIEIQAGEHTFTAAEPLPDDLSEALRAIHQNRKAH
jgi:hypothetical protein